MGLLWFVLPPLLILPVRYGFARWRPDRAFNPFLLTAAVALAASVGVFMLTSASARWRGRVEIAWLGIDAPSASAPAQLGGEPSGFTLGWPGGHAWPAVTLSRGAGGTVGLEVRGGGGLVEAAGAPVNGRPLQPWTDVAIERFRIRVVDPWYSGPRIEIRPTWKWQPVSRSWVGRVRAWWAGADPALVEFGVEPPLSRVVPLSPFVARPVMELRRRGSPGELQLALLLEEWAARAAIGFDEQDAPRVLIDDPAEVASKSGLALPLALTVRWPTRVLRAEAWDSEQRLHVGFLPPWRVASPLPPRPADPAQPIPLTVAPSPRPGEYVFELPFGRGVRDLRLAAPIVKHPTRGEIFSGAPEPQPRVLLPPGTPRAQEVRTYFAERVRSTTCVPAEPVHACIGLVQDIAQPDALIELLAVAFFSFVLALWLLTPLLARVKTTAWTLAAVLAAVWSLCAVRLLLALRYGMDPAGLDALAVTGVSLAAGALIVVPAGLAGTAILYRERFVPRSPVEARTRFWLLALALAACAGMALVEARRILNLWPNLPSDFDPGVPSGLVLLLIVFAVAGGLGLIHRLLLDGTAQSYWRWSSPVHLPLAWLRRTADMWKRSRDLQEDWRFWIAPALGLVAAAVVFLALSVGSRQVLGDTKLVTEFLLPVLVGFACAFFWIAALQAFKPGTNYRRLPLPGARELVLPVAAFVILPAVIPFVLGDSGGLFSMTGLFVPLGVLLLFSRHARFGVAVLAGCALILITLSLMTRHVSYLPSYFLSWSERGAARVTAYMHGNDVQRMLPMARVISDAGDGLPAGALRGALEHPWETRAIVYRAGWTGAGFGAAPNRRSNVPQGVLQYDSTFSFFIVGDFGLAGGIALFLLYCCPLAAVLVSAWRRLDAGHAVAIVAAAWLLNEAIVHAAVNLGVIPFTGRNLPLLSVNSAADLLRWAVVCWLIVLAVLWRATGSEFLFSEEVAVVAGDADMPSSAWEPAPLASGTAPAGVATAVATRGVTVVRRVRGWLHASREHAIGAVAIVATLLVLGLVIVPGVRVLRKHAELGDPFDWTPFFREVQRYLDEGLLRWDGATWTLDPAPLAARGVRLDGTSVLEQEIARFNALPRTEKAELPDSVAAELRKITSVPDYDALLEKVRQRDALRRPQAQSLFRVARRTAIRDDGREQVIEVPVVDTGLNTSVSFGGEATPERLPSVRFRDRRNGNDVVRGAPLIGPAWISGRWETAFHIGPSLPWIESLRNAVESEWGRRDRTAADRRRFEMLTLDEALQAQAVEFAAGRGRERHAAVLALGLQRSDAYKALPPRVALTVLGLPDGAVLASGGWPRMTPAPGWRSSAQGLLPPSSWLRSRAPGPIAYRYTGDRNFDPIEMGSATKPLWAAAALRVQPALRQQLRTRGPAARERDVFGIPLVETEEAAWDVPNAPDWVNFQQYLARSDNRYQVRLGFLGLAEAQQGRIVADGPSASEAESLTVRDGAPVPWRRVPRFVPEIGFSVRQPKTFQDLNRTRMAAELRQLFGISVEAGDYERRRRSLWTLNEEDDRFGAAPASLSSRFLEISPAVTHLALHRTRSAREYVSLLLGGDDNRWSNVDFAAAFGTAISGRAVVPHLVPGDARPWGGRAAFPETSVHVRAGLAEAVRAGTATRALQESGVLDWIQKLGVSAYAKTGTLSTDGGRTETSRLVIALVRWDNAAQGRVGKGLVLSLVVERAEMGYAARALGEFMAANREHLRRLLDSR